MEGLEKELAKSYDMITRMHQQSIDDLNGKMEETIKQRLKDCGFEFKDKIEFYQFAKDRCTIHSHPNQEKELYVDDMLIAKWNTRVKIEEKDGVFSASINIL